MAYKHPQAYELAQRWVKWMHTRKLFAEPSQKNILAQFMPHKSGEMPDAELSDELHAFNLALWDQTIKNRVPFMTIYAEIKEKPVKTLSYELNMSRDTFYRRAHNTAKKLVKITKWATVRNKSDISIPTLSVK